MSDQCKQAYIGRTSTIVAAALHLFPTIAHADIIWGPLLLARGVSAWPSVVTGLIVEFFFVRWLFGIDISRALLADLSMNAVSSCLGLVVWRFAYPPLSEALLSAI